MQIFFVNSWAWLVAHWPIDRRDITGAIGFGALLYGISLVSNAGAWITGGAILFVGWCLALLASLRARKG